MTSERRVFENEGQELMIEMDGGLDNPKKRPRSN